MPRPKKSDNGRPIETYAHTDKERLNNPPVGLVTPDTDPESAAKTYQYDPHLDPQLTWAGKAEHTSFEVPTVSLHVHERIDPRTIVEAVRHAPDPNTVQFSLFDSASENPPIRDAIDFYRHPHGWSNRLIAGDSLLVMNSLLEKEGMAGKVQMVYIDPPYGIKYGSNFQPFVNKRDVKDGKDEDLTAEPETLKAFRDTWELGIHSYLSYLRDRLLLARELLTESGSIFVQISDENVHHVRELLDEVFGSENFQAQINFKSMQALGQSGMAKVYDYLLWYSRSKGVKFHPLFTQKNLKDDREYRFIDDGSAPKGYRRLSEREFQELPNYFGIFRRSALTSSGFTPTCTFSFELEGAECKPFGRKSWRTNRDGIQTLKSKNRLFLLSGNPYFKLYYNDFPFMPLENSWTEQAPAEARLYVVQTGEKFIQRCVLMTTDPGDLVFDPTCGSATTAFVAEQWGRRWITCDTSRVAVTLAKQRLMTAIYDYFELAHPEEGVGSGFRYKSVPHITLKSIANNEPHGMETLYDQPYVDKQRVRVSGPFTVEAVPAPTVKAVDDLLPSADEAEISEETADTSIARSGETLRQAEWRDELLRTGIRGKAGQHIRFARIEPLPGCRWLHSDAETRPSAEGAASVKEDAPAYTPMRTVVSFGSAHAPLDKCQVELALQEALTLVPKPKLLVFAAFQFDPEAAKDIDETKWPGVTLLKAQMNADLLTEDLKKKRASNESFWLIGQPDVQLEHIGQGDDKGKYRVSVHGFDYYNTKTGDLESGGADKIAVWLLDTDYDGRSLYPRQVFFPLAGDDEGWARLSRNLKAEIDPDLIEAYRGTVSLPFAAGPRNRIAVKIVDDRGIESIKVLTLERD